MARFDFRGLAVPLVAAPMAGGPSTPELVAAATNAGGLGMIAGGLLTAEALAAAIRTTGGLTSRPFGVNLFVPQPTAGGPPQFAAYARALAPEARRYGVEVGTARHDDGQWAAKLEMLFDIRPDVVSFTFGIPTAEECSRLHGAGIATVATVTALWEATEAMARGVDALVVQGPSAGGHRATFNPAQPPPAEPLSELFAAVHASVDVPVVVAGGLTTADDVARSVAAGATAVQLGTAFLLADEAGTHPTHRAALCGNDFTETVVTRSFTGRYARGLRNRFIDDHDAQAPAGFPEIAQMTGPLQAAAADRGDPHGMALWAGTEFRRARSVPVADIVLGLF